MPRTWKVLCVAEKPMIAREVSKALNGVLPANQAVNGVCNYAWTYQARNHDTWNIIFTAVRGHVMEHAFPDSCKSWQGVPIHTLFDVDVIKRVAEGNVDVADNLQQKARDAEMLVLWLDCDREGEAIAFEVIDICLSVRPNLVVKRARFSALVATELRRAMDTLVPPNKHEADAVDCRSIMDLRSGAAFTRFQTLLLSKTFDWRAGGCVQHNRAGFEQDSILISYGSCQYPTLGLIVQRQWEIKAHVPEPFWHIQMSYRQGATSCDFTWARGRLYDHGVAAALYNMCVDEGEATVTRAEGREKKRQAPSPLSTLEMQKVGTGILRMSGEQIMAHAEALYHKGLISYPRTETDEFDPAQDLMGLVVMLAEGDRTAGNGAWGWAQHALRIAVEPHAMWRHPRSGGHNDNAHPPIHPTQFVNSTDLQGPEKQLYEFIVRSFLAACSLDAVGFETTIGAQVAMEEFSASGLMVVARNWLDVYPYTRWGGTTVPELRPGDKFVPSSLLLTEGRTQPPPKLSERDLLTLMDTHGIGTDATVAEHIAKQQLRGYAEKDDRALFSATNLGEALIGAYFNMDLRTVYSPKIRGQFEEQLRLIARGQKNINDVLQLETVKYKEAFVTASQKQRMLVDAMALFFPRIQGGAGGANGDLIVVGRCECGGTLFLQSDQDDPRRRRIECSCAVAALRAKRSCMANVSTMWVLPNVFREFEVLNQKCERCQRLQKVRARLNMAGVMMHAPGRFEGDTVETCVICDPRMVYLFEQLGKNVTFVRRRAPAGQGGRGAGPPGRGAGPPAAGRALAQAGNADHGAIRGRGRNADRGRGGRGARGGRAGGGRGRA